MAGDDFGKLPDIDNTPVDGTLNWKTPQSDLPDTVVTSAKPTTVDPLATLKMLNVGVGAGVYKDRIDNTFLFKSIKAGTDILIDVSDDEITINSTATGGGGGPSDPVSFFDLTDAPAKAGNNGKVLGLVGGNLAWVNLPTSIGEFGQLSDVPHSYSGAGGKFVAVKQNEGGLEYVDPPTGGGGGTGNTTRYDAVISWDGNSVPTVTGLPAGWTFANDPDIPGRIIINHTTGKIPYGVSVLAYQDDVAALTPLGTGLYRISMATATLTTQFMVNIPSLSPIGGSVNSTGQIFFLF